MASLHNCGTCKKGFKTEAGYLDHECTTGFTPKEPEHLGDKFLRIQESALARGEARKG